jgi:hypothetical protein
VKLELKKELKRYTLEHWRRFAENAPPKLLPGTNFTIKSDPKFSLRPLLQELSDIVARAPGDRMHHP